MPNPGHTRRYTAFVSYRHADNTQEGRRWAEWLHRALERYVVPPDLIGTPNLRGEPIRDSLYPIFRDEDELPANADLASGIRAALEVSDHLIVLCSPRSAVSPWVRKEVREFKELGRCERILAIIIAGEPNVDDPAKAREGIMCDEECFCEELRYGAVHEDGTLEWTVRAEPLAADLRPGGMRAEGFVTAEAYREHLTLNSSFPPEKIAALTETYRQRLDQALLKVIAGLLGVPLGQLIDRDAAHRADLARRELSRAEAEATRLRTLNRRLASAAAVALALGLLASYFGWQAAREKRRAQVNEGEAKSAQARAEETLHKASVADYGTARRLFGEDVEESADGMFLGVDAVRRKYDASLTGKWHQAVAYAARALERDSKNQQAVALLYETIVSTVESKRDWPIRSFIVPKEATGFFCPPRDLSGNGFQLAYAEKSRVTILNLEDNKTIWEPTDLGGPVEHLALSPNGAKLAVVTSKDGGSVVRLWDVASRRSVGGPLAFKYGTFVSFDSKGLRFWIDNSDQCVICDAATGQPVQRLKNVKALCAGGQRVLSKPGLSYEVREVASETVTCNLHEDASSRFSYDECAFSPDGNLIAVAGECDSVRICQLYDANSGEPVGKRFQHGRAEFNKHLRRVAFSPDNTRYAVSWPDECIDIFNATTGEPKRLKTDDRASLIHTDAVSELAFSPDGLCLATASLDGWLRFWDSETLHPLSVPCKVGFPLQLSFNREGTRLAVFNGDGIVSIWEVPTRKPVAEPLWQEAFGVGLHFSADGNRCVTLAVRDPWFKPGTENKYKSFATVWDWASRDSKWFVEGLFSVARLNGDGTRLAVAHEKTVNVWAEKSLKRVGKMIESQARVLDVAFASDTELLTTESDSVQRRWNLLNGEMTSESAIKLPRYGVTTGVSPNGRHHFKADGADIVISDEEEEVPRGIRLPHDDTPYAGASVLKAAAFSPSGSELLVATGTAVWIWDMRILDNQIETPAWFIDWAYAVSGWSFDKNGQLQVLPMDKRLDVLAQPHGGADPFSQLASWVGETGSERPIHPGATLTARQAAERARDFGFEESLRYATRFDSTVPLARLALAGVLHWKSLNDGANGSPGKPSAAESTLIGFLREFDLERVPDEVPMLRRTAELLEEQEQLSLALNYVDRAITKLSSEAVSHGLRGEILEALKRKTEAIAAFKEAARLDPKSIRWINSAAYLSAQLGLRDEAVGLIRQGKSLGMNDYAFWQTAGFSYINLKDPRSALEAFRRSKLLLSVDEEVQERLRTGLAIAYWLNQQQDEAVEIYAGLINNGRTQEWGKPETITKQKWPEAEASPLEDVRVETLKRHPELR